MVLRIVAGSANEEYAGYVCIDRRRLLASDFFGDLDFAAPCTFVELLVEPYIFGPAQPPAIAAATQVPVVASATQVPAVAPATLVPVVASAAQVPVVASATQLIGWPGHAARTAVASPSRGTRFSRLGMPPCTLGCMSIAARPVACLRYQLPPTGRMP